MLERLWVLVLAAGEGSRVRHLTTDASGRGAPKQYASFNGQACESCFGRTTGRRLANKPNSLRKRSSAARSGGMVTAKP